MNVDNFIASIGAAKEQVVLVVHSAVTLAVHEVTLIANGARDMHTVWAMTGNFNDICQAHHIELGTNLCFIAFQHFLSDHLS
ncbi:MAG: hypothetical protein Q7U16_16815 [Agitococcus sp.]|nr:hypothetical protein [Agitococcus sp.]